MPKLTKTQTPSLPLPLTNPPILSDLFQLAELVAEGDEQLAVALPLVGGQGEDTGHVVPVRGLLLLGEIAHNVGTTSGQEKRQLGGVADLNQFRSGSKILLNTVGFGYYLELKTKQKILSKTYKFLR